MKKVIVNEKQEKKLLEHSADAQLEMRNSFAMFFAYIIERIEKIKLRLMEIKDFIEQDSYAKNNEIKFKPFFDDINRLYDLIEHIYDNIPQQ